MASRGTVTIGSYWDGPLPVRPGYAVVATDVIRATTTAVTALATGRSCYTAASVEEAWQIASLLEHPLMAAEQAGETPPGFDMTNSPAAVAKRADVWRPMVLLSSSGTRLLAAARGAEAVYAGCLRNVSALAEHLIGHHPRVALFGAETKAEFREEDQLCCAWIAARLVDAGYEPEDAAARALIARWRDAPADAILVSNSAAYLRRSGQLDDLEFVLSHVDDVAEVYEQSARALVPVDVPLFTPAPALAAAA